MAERDLSKCVIICLAITFLFFFFSFFLLKLRFNTTITNVLKAMKTE